MDTLQLHSKIDSLPENLKSEVDKFIDELLSKVEEEPKKGKAKFGSAKGMYIMSDDFDEPLEDFKDYM